MILFDTHNHFDDPKFDHDRLLLVEQAVDFGMNKMVMTGITANTFERILAVQKEVNDCFLNLKPVPIAPSSIFSIPQPLQEEGESSQKNFAHTALGLHPFFIHQHHTDDLQTLESHLKIKTKLKTKEIIAIGEIGLDTFTKEMKEPKVFAKQQQFFIAQLDLAVKYQLPVLLHIRKAHSDSLRILKNHAYNAHKLGGIAHSFSGGEQEAKAFVKLGFKLGVTGQICNPNAKKLHKAIKSAVNEFGLDCLVIETDCPDMIPLPCYSHLTSLKGRENPFPLFDLDGGVGGGSLRNTPANLIYILNALSELLQVDKIILSEQLWKNSLVGLRL